MAPNDAVEIWNVAMVGIAPSPDTYKALDGGLSVDVDAEVFHYTMEVEADLDAVLKAFQWKTDLTTQQASAKGRLQAWKELHALLQSGGTFTGVEASSRKVTLKTGEVVTVKEEVWDSLWNHTLATAMDIDDKVAASVDHPKISTRTGYHTNLGCHYDVTKPNDGLAAAILEGFYNDITGLLNDMVSGTTTEIVNAKLVSWKPLEPIEAVVLEADARIDYLPALAKFLHKRRKADAFEGEVEKNMYGTLKFVAGDALSFRLKCTMLNTNNVKIKITHKPAAPQPAP